jgi:large subunit ribosomal protein L21
MYAVIETGGKQYRVEVGTELEVELLDVEPGNTITLDRVLLVADGDDASIGQPLVANAAVSAEVLRQARGDKVIAFKYRPKARRRVKRGHRQELTVLRISDITLGAKSAAKTEQKASHEARTERTRLEEAAAEKAAADAELAAKLAARTKTAETETKPKRTRAKAAEAPAEAEAEAEATATAVAETPEATEAAAETTAEATETKPKRTRAKAGGTDAAPAAEAESEATPKPKRTRTTKKDE